MDDRDTPTPTKCVGPATIGSVTINLNDACVLDAFSEYLSRRFKAPCKATEAKQTGNGYSKEWSITFTQDGA